MSFQVKKTSKFGVLASPAEGSCENVTTKVEHHNDGYFLISVGSGAMEAPQKSQKSAAPPKSSKSVSQAPRVDEENLYKSPLSVEEKVAIAMSVGEEVLTPEELTALYTARDHPIVYDGFEPSGRMHIAQGISFNALKQKLNYFANHNRSTASHQCEQAHINGLSV